MARRKKKSSKTTFIIPKVSVETTVTTGDKISSRKKVLGPFKLTRNNDRWNNEQHEWALMVKIGKKYQIIGGFHIAPLFSDNGLTAAICGSEIDYEEYRGFGLARLSYRLLANFYGSLESDPNGITSEDAARVWKALKAKKLPCKRFRIEGEKK